MVALLAMIGLGGHSLGERMTHRVSERVMEKKMTERQQHYLDLQAQFVEWLVVNGHEAEAEKIGAGSDNLKWQDSTWAQEFEESLSMKGVFVKSKVDLPPEGWAPQWPLHRDVGCCG
jgi:hypothetical protein